MDPPVRCARGGRHPGQCCESRGDVKCRMRFTTGFIHLHLPCWVYFDKEMRENGDGRHMQFVGEKVVIEVYNVHRHANRTHSPLDAVVHVFP